MPPYVGHRGWLGVRLDVPVDWDVIAELVADAYRLVAPKRSGPLLRAASWLVAEADGVGRRRTGGESLDHVPSSHG